MELVLGSFDKKTDRPARGPERAPANGKPGWAAGLRKLYDSVVEEPLPDSFHELLKKLDQSDES